VVPLRSRAARPSRTSSAAELERRWFVNAGLPSSEKAAFLVDRLDTDILPAA
jgi:hypothetical protein